MVCTGTVAISRLKDILEVEFRNFYYVDVKPGAKA